MGNPLTIYHSIKSACYNVNLSPAQAQQMHQDIAALKLSGVGNDTSEEQFALDLMNTASKNTMVISTVYNVIIVNLLKIN